RLDRKEIDQWLHVYDRRLHRCCCYRTGPLEFFSRSCRPGEARGEEWTSVATLYGDADARELHAFLDELLRVVHPCQDCRTNRATRICTVGLYSHRRARQCF